LEKIFNFIKRIFLQFVNLVIFVIKEIIYFFPFYIILLIGLNFISINPEDKFSVEQLRIIIASAGLTSILSTLSFRASTSSKNEIDSHIFHLQALRLFYATLLLICAIPLAYMYNNELVSKLTFVVLINKNINLVKLINRFIFVVGLSFLAFGLIIAATATASLNKILFSKKLLA
jgi:hypothetical protein